ncbi:hypothetical protein [Hanstruepera marina]|uniref:hypothetical protein n=1 Tax=Hanstruepera marina TaxID=2873265 RepID=UPI001CA6C5EF|nr:hypothetical protein [Hanstruepera marina]
MKKLQIIMVPTLLLFQALFSQSKEIQGDTTYAYNRINGFQKTLDLKDFEKSADDFNFRFWNHGQVIEISKNSSEINGSITNYTFHTKNAHGSPTDTLINKISLTPIQSADIYDIVQNSKILVLPSDDDIENWRHGLDGTTYIIEHSDKLNYWIKNYWTPSTQKSIPEALIVVDLIKQLSDTLKLREVYTSFENTLPKKGCYNSGGLLNMCYISNALELGYSGATKLPLGFFSSYSATYIGNTKINGSASIQYNFNNDGFHHLNFQIAKWNIFHINSELSDYIAYNYQNRLVNINNTKKKFENHQIKYGLNLKKNIGLGIGLDYIGRNYDKIGGHFFASKRFSKAKISTAVSTSIIGSQINYTADISKSINFNYEFPLYRIYFGIAYENFMGYKDLYFNITVDL